MRQPRPTPAVFRKLFFAGALGCLFVGSQLAIASNTALDCSNRYTDWQGGPVAWGQRKISSVSRALVETVGKATSVNVHRVLEQLPEGC